LSLLKLLVTKISRAAWRSWRPTCVQFPSLVVTSGATFTVSRPLRGYLLEVCSSGFVPMSFYNPSDLYNDALQFLYALDKASPLFHKQLGSFCRGINYQHMLLDLPRQRLVQLVEHLDSVRLKITLVCVTLNIRVDSRRHFRSSRPCIPGILASTWKDM
jgi:hypothetical protein